MAQLCSLLLCLMLVRRTWSQAPQDPIKDFCRRFSHQATVIDRKLYIDGGYLNANPISQNPQAVINQGLFYEDLNTTAGGMPAPYANFTKNSSVPDVAGGVLWADEVNKIFYLYGGEFSGVPQSFQLWGYDTILNQWNLSTTPTTDVQRVSYGAGVAVSQRAEGYYYGGYLNNMTNPGWTGSQVTTSNLVKYDMNDNSWTNNTGPDAVGRAEGVLVFVPASASGLLIYFGGVTDPFENGTVQPSPLDTIYVYEIAESKWYTQTATGDIPEDRRKFCGGATWARDQSSYNIYIYGGAGFGPNVTGFDDVYILTMPAFHWIKWYPTQPGPGSPHNSLTCTVVDNAQMLVIGGTFPNSTACDAPEVVGNHNLNLGENDPTHAMWASYQPNLTTYNVPPEILKVIGGSATGGATVKAPSAGWDNRDLPVYFGEQASFTARTPTRIIPTPTASPGPPPPPPPPKKKSSNTGAIVGGVVGGVAALLAVCALGFFCVRRRRRNASQPAKSPAKPTFTSELPSDGVASPQAFSLDPKNSQYGSFAGSPPASTRSPVHNFTATPPPQGIYAYSPPPPVQQGAFDPRTTASPAYHAPYHSPPQQVPMNQEYFPPPGEVVRADPGVSKQYFPPPPQQGSAQGVGLQRPEPRPAERSYEMPTVRSPDSGRGK